MKKTKKPGPIDGYIIEIPSKWYKTEKIYHNVGYEIHSVWGTSDDHEYGKKELEAKFSQVEECTPEQRMPNLGLMNWVDDEWTKYKEKEVVEEEAVWDPDEWDNFGDPDAKGNYNTWLSTPEINLKGIEANSITLT